MNKKLHVFWLVLISGLPVFASVKKTVGIGSLSAGALLCALESIRTHKAVIAQQVRESDVQDQNGLKKHEEQTYWQRFFDEVHLSRLFAGCGLIAVGTGICAYTSADSNNNGLESPADRPHGTDRPQQRPERPISDDEVEHCFNVENQDIDPQSRNALKKEVLLEYKAFEKARDQEQVFELKKDPSVYAPSFVQEVNEHNKELMQKWCGQVCSVDQLKATLQVRDKFLSVKEKGVKPYVAAQTVLMSDGFKEEIASHNNDCWKDHLQNLRVAVNGAASYALFEDHDADFAALAKSDPTHKSWKTEYSQWLRSEVEQQMACHCNMSQFKDDEKEALLKHIFGNGLAESSFCTFLNAEKKKTDYVGLSKESVKMWYITHALDACKVTINSKKDFMWRQVHGLTIEQSLEALDLVNRMNEMIWIGNFGIGEWWYCVQYLPVDGDAASSGLTEEQKKHAKFESLIQSLNALAHIFRKKGDNKDSREALAQFAEHMTQGIRFPTYDAKNGYITQDKNKHTMREGLIPVFKGMAALIRNMSPMGVNVDFHAQYHGDKWRLITPENKYLEFDCPSKPVFGYPLPVY